MNREILFPTPVYMKMVKDPKKLNKYLYPLIKAWSKKDKSETKTNAGGGWHSPTDMNHKKEYKPLIDELFVMQEEIYKDYGMEPKPGLGNMWANINYPGSYRRLTGLPKALWRMVIYPAIEGQMVMFPAWLPHGVEMNESKEKGEKGWRVSVSFNFIQINELAVKMKDK